MPAATLDVFLPACGRFILLGVLVEFSRDHLVSDARIASVCTAELLSRFHEPKNRTQREVHAAVVEGRLGPRLAAIFADNIRRAALISMTEVLGTDVNADKGAIVRMAARITESALAEKLPLAGRGDIELLAEGVARLALAYTADCRTSGMHPLTYARRLIPDFE